MIRHFLGWDRPLVEVAAEFLLDGIAGMPFDLSRVMVVVPTRQAGRLLREQLATAAQRRGTLVLTPLVVQPSYLVRAHGAVATPAECLAVFAEVLATLDYARYQALFPGDAPGLARDFGWCLDTAELLLDLRNSLAEGGFTPAPAVARLGADPNFPEPERWQCLARLETRFADALARHGLCDPARAQFDAARDPVLPDGLERVAIIGVPDPVPLAVTAWEQLDRTGRRIEVCIHAPADLAPLFDDWGRPRRDAWRERLPPIPDGVIHLVPKPQDQADMAVRLLPENLEPAQAPGLLALGVLDDEVLPHLENAMDAAGIPVFNPALRPVGSHALYHLVRDVLTLATDDGFDEFASLLRNPLALRYFSGAILASAEDGSRGRSPSGPEQGRETLQAQLPQGAVTADRLLRAADDLQNHHLPGSFAAVRERTRSREWQAARRNADSGLARVCEVISGWLERLRGPDWPRELRAILRTVLGVQPGVHALEPDPLPQVAEAMQELLAALESPVVRAVLPESAKPRHELFLRLLARLSVGPEHPGRRVDLDGWLELHWNNAPLLIVTGFNEGRVPAAVVGHAFLPDRARGMLGLTDNGSRLARDSYLLGAMLACRSQPGSVQIIVGKTTAAGDVLRPSQLLFGGARDADLARRVEQLFGPVEAAPAAPPQAAATPFLRVPWTSPRPRLSVTALADYLKCPFRFYLRHVLGMSEQDDRKRELDALDYGTVAHEVLARFAADTAWRDSTDENAIARFLTDGLADVFEARFGRNLSAALLLQKSSLEQRLRYAAAEQARSRQAHWRIAELDGQWSEHGLNLTLDGCTIQARIDRIDRHEETGQYRILDYKTSNTASKPVKTHLASAKDDMPAWRVLTGANDGKAWGDLQLPMYCLMLQERLGPVNVTCGYFNLPKAVTETKIAAFDELDADMLESVRACAAGIVEAVRAGVFWPPANLSGYLKDRDEFGRLCAGDWMTAFDRSAWPGGGVAGDSE
ncbi:MAG: hypothetical protein A3K19_23535 [Lentisphaerae bacterium RIFOXYB12_FULL_65_16]|nr:MAG: hypothetical protein A3K18_29270 [Lentisphaerae bacterium RIFOXYA12_64_32]OGV94071.1 MAG: hypothetical protein A3K19_23535 [Lentisphaerae bacterium RIFOXYB12_FULL_65_16]